MAEDVAEATESLPKEAGLVGLDRPLDQLDLTKMLAESFEPQEQERSEETSPSGDAVEEAKNWPTPLEDDASNVNPSEKRMKTLVSSTKGSGMKLNPNWVEQLMGLPAGWTQLPAHWLTG